MDDASTKKVCMSAAAAFAVVVISINSSQSLAYAMSNVPVIGDVVKIFTFREYKERRGTMEAEIKTPNVSGLENKSQKQINREMEAYTETIKTQFQKDMQREEGSHQSVTTDYKILLNNDKYLSVKIQTTESSGSSDAYSKNYNVNKKTGEILSLKKVCGNRKDYQEVITKEIISQMKKQMKKDSQTAYFIKEKGKEMLAEPFTTILPDQNYYIKADGSIVIVFDKYQVTPGSMGQPEFHIEKKVWQKE